LKKNITTEVKHVHGVLNLVKNASNSNRREKKKNHTQRTEISWQVANSKAPGIV
jgi:hypothetical protein